MGGPVVVSLAALLCLAGWFAALIVKTAKMLVPRREGDWLGKLKRIALHWISWVAAAAICWVVVCYLYPISTAEEAANRARCLNHLKKIGTAMRRYHDKYGAFPPAYVADQRGRPVHSWRVLILPHMGDPELRKLYEQYDFTQPWNSPHNIALADRIPDCYRCPNDSKNRKSDTSYVMVVGPGTISDGLNGAKLEELQKGDGADCTIAVVEMSDSGINWLQPWDLDFEQMSFRINDESSTGLRSGHTKYHVVVNVLFADGSVHTLSGDIDPDVLRALLTIAGGEEVSEDW